MSAIKRSEGIGENQIRVTAKYPLLSAFINSAFSKGYFNILK